LARAPPRGWRHPRLPLERWEQSYVTADRVYCVYLAESEQMVRQHAERAGFPCTKVSDVAQVIDPLTASLQNAWSSASAR